MRDVYIPPQWAYRIMSIELPLGSIVPIKLLIVELNQLLVLTTQLTELVPQTSDSAGSHGGIGAGAARSSCTGSPGGTGGGRGDAGGSASGSVSSTGSRRVNIF